MSSTSLPVRPMTVEESETVNINIYDSTSLHELLFFIDKIKELIAKYPNAQHEDTWRNITFVKEIDTCDNEECNSKYESVTGLQFKLRKPNN